MRKYPHHYQSVRVNLFEFVGVFLVGLLVSLAIISAVVAG